MKAAGASGPILDAIETTLGWDTIYEAEKERVMSPVSRVWSVNWGGYVIFDWDTFFAATMAGIGEKDLAYANALETLREETPQGFVPNFARAGEWKCFDSSEPPVGAITVLGLYRQVSREVAAGGCFRAAAAVESLVGGASRSGGIDHAGQRSRERASEHGRWFGGEVAGSGVRVGIGQQPDV